MTMEETSASEADVSMLVLMLVFSWARPPWLSLRYSLVLALCEPFSLFHEIIDNLFLCDNGLHKLEVLYYVCVLKETQQNPEQRLGVITYSGNQ